MTISSMTGFAREAGVTGPYQWVWEIKTVNGRGLDVRLRTPPGYDGVGEDARQQVLKALARGMCQLNLSMTRAATTPRARVNQDVLAALVDAIAGLDLPGSVRPASVDGLLAVRGVVEFEDEAESETLQQAIASDLRHGIGRMIEALQETRRGEGRALAEVIEARLAEIERLVDMAESCPARQPEAIKARLQSQLSALLEAAPALDPARLHQEAVLVAARADIREELDRLRAHVGAARDVLKQGGAVGRRLDFLAQEFGREANTLCAKANDVSLSRIGLDLKAIVEQFREQVQNVE
jgi:uncharacterized protein (TIGR00255 family)